MPSLQVIVAPAVRLRPQQLKNLQVAYDKMMYWRAIAMKKGDSADRDSFRRHTDRFFALVEMHVHPIGVNRLDYSRRDLRRRPREDA